MLNLIVCILGCKPNIEKMETREEDILEIQDTGDVGSYSLAIALDTSSVIAGENVSYTLSFLDPNGEMVDNFSWSVTSSLEESLQWTSKQIIEDIAVSQEDQEEIPEEVPEEVPEEALINGVGNIRPLVAGIHDFSFVIEWQEETYLATTTLDVIPSGVYSLDLQLSDIAIPAGGIINYEVFAVDRFGNNVDILDVAVVSDDIHVEMDETQITSTIPGIYTVSASVEESDIDGNLVVTTDVEQFQVQPGPAVSMDLVVDQQGDVEINDTLHCEVLIWDAYGNRTNDTWDLWTVGSNDTTISYENVTFPFEGEYTIYASVDNSNLMDAHGPIFIDSTGPVISIFSPERGGWSTTENWTVTGNVFDAWSNIVDVTVNGDTVALDATGNFTSEQQFDFGVNLVETYAIDSDGNESQDTRAVLYGEFLVGHVFIEDGLTVYIGDNANGLGVIEDFGEDMIGSIDIQGMLPPNPMINQSSSNEVCWCIWGCCSTVTWYAVSLNVGNVSYGAGTLDLDAKGNGTIDVQFTLPSLSIDWWANGTLVGVGYSGSGDITASSVVVTANLSANVSNGNLNVNINSVNTAINNLNFDMDGWVYDVISFFGLDGVIENVIEGAIQDAVSGAVEDEVPALLEDTLQSLEIQQDIDLMGSNYAFVGRPSSVTVTEYGIELGLEANIAGDQWVHSGMGGGSLYAGYTSPLWNAYTGMGIGISVDFLNQMLYQIWGGGLLDMTLSGNELGLQGDEIALIFPGATDLRITVEPLLPPVAAPQAANLNQLELQIGDMYLALHNGPLEDQDVRLELYMSLFAPLNLSASATALGVEIAEPIVYFDVVYPEANSKYAESSESILQALIPYLLPTLTNALTEIEIPSIEGFSIGGVSSSTNDGYVRLSGQLLINP